MTMCSTNNILLIICVNWSGISFEIIMSTSVQHLLVKHKGTLTCLTEHSTLCDRVSFARTCRIQSTVLCCSPPFLTQQNSRFRLLCCHVLFVLLTIVLKVGYFLAAHEQWKEGDNQLVVKYVEENCRVMRRVFDKRKRNKTGDIALSVESPVPA